MSLKKIFSSGLVFLLSFAMVDMNFAARAQAGMISTSVVISDFSRVQNLEKVNGFIMRAEVQKELILRGVVPAEASKRIAALSDFEIQQLAGNVDNVAAGADVVVISLTAVLLIVLILILLRRA